MLDNNLKRWESLKYKNSTEWLKQLREIELKSTSLNLDDRVRALRTNKLKIWRESRQAALFCHGISKRLGHPIDIAMCEDQDYDFVARYETPGVYMNYIPVQLKEFVPDYLNLAQSLNDIFESIIKKYPTSRDLTVAIYINRELGLDFNNIDVPEEMKVGYLWVYGSLSEDQSEWFLFGNLKEKDPILTKFEYPS